MHTPVGDHGEQELSRIRSELRTHYREYPSRSQKDLRKDILGRAENTLERMKDGEVRTLSA